MFCKNCGKELTDKAVVCINCGVAVYDKHKKLIRNKNQNNNIFTLDKIFINISLILLFAALWLFILSIANGSIYSTEYAWITISYNIWLPSVIVASLSTLVSIITFIINLNKNLFLSTTILIISIMQLILISTSNYLAY